MIVINMVAGPGSGKTTFASGLYYEMKKKGLKVEFLQEYIKKLIFKKDFKNINNQFKLSYEQYNEIKMFENLDLDYLIVDTCLLSQIYYNITNKHNISDKKLVERCIYKWFSEFDNFIIFINRGGIEFDKIGRIHNKEDSEKADIFLKNLLKINKLIYFEKTITDVSTFDFTDIINRLKDKINCNLKSNIDLI